MKKLLDLEASQSGLLDMLRDPTSGQSDMLTQLLVTSCQFELSKLVSARLDLGSFADAAVGVLSQFATADRCALMLVPEGLPPVRATVGEWPQTEADAATTESPDGLNARDCLIPGIVGAVIAVSTKPMGRLSAVGLPESLRRADLITKAAEQISNGLELLLEAERTRRAAAAARAVEIVSTLDVSFSEEDLASLTAALAGLSNAIGAKLNYENRRLGGPVECVSGKTDGADVGTSVFEQLVDARHPLRVELTWTMGRTDSDVARAAEIVDVLGVSLSRIEQNARLQQEVETDPLTGVGNRRLGSRTLARAFNRAQRGMDPMAVLMMDLDKFKNVNDKLGHQVGDAVLVAFARALEGAVRNYDVTARWGGEEFLIICPDTDLAGAQALASRVLKMTPEFCQPALPEDWRQTVSIGIAVFPHGAEFADGLVRAADKALYQAKSAGRDQYAVSEPEVVAAGATKR